MSAPATWVCGLTIVSSAFLVFLVQPILGKMILPWFGGSAGVWSACLVFFQTFLLAGYAYAHGLTRLVARRRQVATHAIFVAASLLVLPILPSPAWRYSASSNPNWRILALLASTVGLPYMLLAATSPLLQAWYSELGPGGWPYRFYSLSNLGSIVGLLSFPLLIEPRLTSRAQAVTWSAGYIVFALLCLAAAGHAMTHREARGKLRSWPDDAIDNVPVRVRLAWVGLAACGSGLLLAVTNQLSQNVAPVPLIWTLPLTAYLLSFVLCFRDRFYKRPTWIPAMLTGVAAMAFYTYANHGNPDPEPAVAAFLLGLFACCMVCHGELARLTPKPRLLTSFYLWLSAGGVLGSFFVAIIAPHLFKTNTELPLLLTTCAALTPAIFWKSSWRRGLFASLLLRTILLGLPVTLASYLIRHQIEADRPYRQQVRNFYGVLRVRDGIRSSVPPGETPDEDRVRMLFHGTIEHGAQLLDPHWRREPTDYYIGTSGIGLAMGFIRARPAVRVGIIGLGAGVLASYCRAGDLYRFYEINPDVEAIARSAFTFLADCPGKIDVLQGDARLTLETQFPQQFDLLAVDAFSGDAIPVHLLTQEACREYFRHLRTDGILAINVSNRYLDLVPVVAAVAHDLRKKALVVDDDGRVGKAPAASRWMLLGGPEELDHPAFQTDSADLASPDPSVRPWTDDYSNLLQLLNLARKER
jgi:SAM-dependent methyltransferase